MRMLKAKMPVLESRDLDPDLYDRGNVIYIEAGRSVYKIIVGNRSVLMKRVRDYMLYDDIVAIMELTSDTERGVMSSVVENIIDTITLYETSHE